jgi:hypothetical protein
MSALASRTVCELAAASGLRFEKCGTHTLMGVPGSWKLLGNRCQVAFGRAPAYKLSAISSLTWCTNIS